MRRVNCWLRLDRKRRLLAVACDGNHDLSDVPIKDPADRRRTLRPAEIKDVLYKPCKKCGHFIYTKAEGGKS